MRIAVVSDIHGNLPALQAVEEDLKRAGVDAVVDLGDCLSGPLWPAETARRLMALAWPTIRGNHERQLLDRDRARMGASDRFARERLDDAALAWVAALPLTLRPFADVFACHGTPTSDLAYFLETVTPDLGRDGSPGVRLATPAEAAARADAVRAGLILCGHTHTPRCVALDDGRLVVNPGSVGLQAYDDDHPHAHRVEIGSPHARYAVVESTGDGWQVQLRAVPYDWESAARRAEAHGRGDWADALRTGRVGRLEAEVCAMPPGQTANGGGVS
jgi:predicted phosphodiesterase